MSGRRYSRRIAYTLAALLACGGAAFAQDKAFSNSLSPSNAPSNSPSMAPSMSHSKGGPIIITSATLSADRKSNTAFFEGNVIARSEDMTLYADRMKVTYTPDGALDRIEAEGSVRLVKEGRVLTADMADYLVSTRKMTFTGNARAVEEGNVVTGSTIVYLVDEERYLVEGGRVYIDTKKPPEEKK